jgi:hypothetical protein
MEIDPQTFYATQSEITEPGAYIHLFADLPRDIASLCKVVQGLIIHYHFGAMYGYTIPDNRLSEVDTRSVEKMLARISELDPRSLTEERPPEKRLVGCCRDSASLFCSMARYWGIPARVRIGFSAYFDRHFKHDHAIVEYLDVTQKRWKLVDPEMSEKHVASNPLISFDVLDIPRDRFIVAGKAWQRCRSGKANPDLFCVSPEGDLRGWWFIGDELVRDLAALNKMELLLWDSWGLMGAAQITTEKFSLLDKVAMLTLAGDEAFAQTRTLYERNGELMVTLPLISYSPIAGPQQVTSSL